MARGESEHQPVVGSHEGVPIDVAAELFWVGVLSALVLESDLPAVVAEVGGSHLTAETVADPELHSRLWQPTVQQPESQQALPWRCRTVAQVGCPAPGAHDPAHAIGTSQPTGQGVVVDVASAHQPVPENEENIPRQNGRKIEECLRSCGDA